MIRRFLRYFGLASSIQDQKLKDLIDSPHETICVVGRGSIKKVSSTAELNEAARKSKSIMEEAEETFQMDVLQERIVSNALKGKCDYEAIKAFGELRAKRFMPKALQEGVRRKKRDGGS